MRIEGQGMATGTLPRAKGEITTQNPKPKEFDAGRENKSNIAVVKKAQPQKEELKIAMESANQVMQMANYELRFRMHEESGRLHIKVINESTEEVIREIPSESMLEFSAKVKEMIDKLHKSVGLLVDEFV